MSAPSYARVVIAAQLRVAIDDATDAATLEQLGADRIDAELLAITLEDALGIVITDDELAACTTVGDLLQICAAKQRPATERNAA